MVQTSRVKLDNNGSVNENCISEYQFDEPMTKDEIVVGIETLRHLFNINENALDAMCEIMAQENWSLRKLIDARKYVLKTHKYKEVKPADILSYDKNIKFYSYLDMLELGGDGFRCIHIPGIPNKKSSFDPIEGYKTIDVGWYVKINELIPESWDIIKP